MLCNNAYSNMLKTFPKTYTCKDFTFIKVDYQQRAVANKKCFINGRTSEYFSFFIDKQNYKQNTIFYFVIILVLKAEFTFKYECI